MKIKTLFRTILAIMVAVVMSMSLVVFAACGPDSKDPDPDPDYVDTNIPADTIDEILATDYSALELLGTVGVKTGSAKGTSNVNGKINLDGTADITFRQDGEDGGYVYVFMRDWAVYGVLSEDEVTAENVADAEFEGLVDIEAAIEEMLGAYDVELPEELELGGLVKVGMDVETGALLKVANVAGAVSEEDGVVTLNINKLIYNIIRDLKGFVSSLKGSTTIGNILGNETLKNYSQLVTELVTPQDLVDFVAALLEYFGGSDAPAALDDEYPEYPDESEIAIAYVGMALNLLNAVFEEVEPDENSTTYDYIVKVISSQELVDAINSVFEEMLGEPVLEGKLTDITLNDIVALSGEDVSVKDMVAAVNGLIDSYTSGITPKSFSVIVEDMTPYVLSNAKIYYTYGKSGLTSQKLEADLVINTYEADSKGNMTLEDKITLDIDLTYNYKAAAYAASDFMPLPDDLPEIDNDFGPGGDIEVVPGATELNVGLQNMAGYTVVADEDEDNPGECAYFFVTVEEEGQYVIAVSETDEGGIPYIVVFDAHNEYVEAADYDMDGESSMYLYNLEAGVYYITVCNFTDDIGMPPVSGSGMIAIIGDNNNDGPITGDHPAFGENVTAVFYDVIIQPEEANTQDVYEEWYSYFEDAALYFNNDGTYSATSIVSGVYELDGDTIRIAGSYEGLESGSYREIEMADGYLRMPMTYSSDLSFIVIYEIV